MLEMSLKVDDEKVILENDLLFIKIYKSFASIADVSLLLFFKEGIFKSIKIGKVIKKSIVFDEVVVVEIKDQNIELNQILNDFENEVDNEYVKCIRYILDVFNYSFEEKKESGKKKQYRFVKAVSQMEFNTDYLGTKATIVWQSRNEVLLKKGAHILSDIPLNKDGTIGFSVKMGEQLRQMNSSFIKENKTTDDIILKSINEVGLFLYFGGTNSWLVFKNSDGITIDEICGK